MMIIIPPPERYCATRVTYVSPQEPLTLREVKEFLRISITKDDSLLQHLISTVREAAEQYLQRSLVKRQLIRTYEGEVPTHIVLPMPPVLYIEKVAIYTTTKGEPYILAPSYYTINEACGSMRLAYELSYPKVEISYTVGYDEEHSLPSALRTGMLYHLQTLYNQRHSEEAIPTSSLALYTPHRFIPLG